MSSEIRLAKENKRLPILGNDDHNSNFQYVKQFQLEDEKKLGKKFDWYARINNCVGNWAGITRIKNWLGLH